MNKRNHGLFNIAFKKKLLLIKLLCNRRKGHFYYKVSFNIYQIDCFLFSYDFSKNTIPLNDIDQMQ